MINIFIFLIMSRCNFIYPNKKKCDKPAHFGFSTDKSSRLRCKEHKEKEMIDLTRKTCIGNDNTCPKRALFGIEGDKKPSYCLRCSEKLNNDKIIKTEKRKMCEICQKTEPTFGYIDENGNKQRLRCKTCMADDMIDLYHDLCEVCNKVQATYGFPDINKRVRCSEHKLDGMIVIGKVTCPCGKVPSFGYLSDKKAICCIECKKDDMINLKIINCTYEGCTITAIYGEPDDKKPTRCKTHKTETMEDLVHGRCGCPLNRRATFGYKDDKKPTCCKACKKEGMEDLVNKYDRCSCGKKATFGYEDDKKPTCCDNCKKEGMINLKDKNRKCGCKLNAIARYGFKTDNKPTCCSVCRSKGMENIYDKRCLCGLVPNPNWGYPEDGIRLCCKKCVLPNMIDLKNKLRCPCGNHPVFGYKKDNKRIACLKCKKEDMEPLNRRICLCNSKSPWYGWPTDDYPTCCKDCKEEGMEPLYDRCKSEFCKTTGNRYYDGYCTFCFSNLFPNDPRTPNIRKKSKEIQVRDYINQHFDGFIHDKPMFMQGCDCLNLCRIDLRKLIGNTMFCIEIDENQHKYYNQKKEVERYDNMMMIFTGKWYYIRFNPDKYKDKDKNIKNPRMDTRLKKLKEVVETKIKLIEQENNKNLITIEYLYYDE
jgi:hypothetical protein